MTTIKDSYRKVPTTLLTYKESAAIAKISERQLQRNISSGEIAVVKFSSRVARIRWADLEAWINRHRIASKYDEPIK